MCAVASWTYASDGLLDADQDTYSVFFVFFYENEKSSKVVTHLQVNCPATYDVEASSEDAGTDHSLETHVTLAHLHHATITVITHVSKSLRQTKSLFCTMFL